MIFTRLVRAAAWLFTSPWLPDSSAQPKTIQITEKDLRMAAIYKVEPEYPAVARQIRLAGDVLLEVSVDPSGSVSSVSVIKGNTLLAGSSTQAIKKWKFTPFRVDGQPARATGRIDFNFQM